ncbi:MAG: hypothetical protein C0506_09835 [Anaerolinea sp.]|nr:hypothetical protein [Anaerolinea sp.]
MYSILRITGGAALLAATLLPGTALAAGHGNGAGGVTGPAFYVDGALYRTVGTPTNFSNTGAPDHSYDTIYAFGGGEQRAVATAAPGDPGFNGGRWQVAVLSFADYAAAVGAYDANGSGDFDSDEEVLAAIAGGAATTSAGPSFECPVIPLPHRGA